MTSSNFFTVAIPTFRRPDVLRAAIASVAAQTDPDWDIVVSDDEPGDGESWTLLGQLIADGLRLTRSKNRYASGQVGNTNTALEMARGRWIKLLHDDDEMAPHCLARLRAVVECYPDAASVGCEADLLIGQRLVRYRRGVWPRLERIARSDVVAAMYLLEDVGSPRPSLNLVAHRAIAAGARFATAAGVESSVDCVFAARVAEFGDRLILREALVRYRVWTNSVSGTLSRAAHDEEFCRLRLVLHPLADRTRGLPAPETMVAMIRAHRAIAHLRIGALADGWRAFRSTSMRGWALFLIWCLHRASGGRISRRPRMRLRSGVER